MPVCHARRLSVFLVCLCGSAIWLSGVANGWQGSGPDVSAPPRMSVPRIQPAEEFIIPASTATGSSRRTPNESPAGPAEFVAANGASKPILKPAVFKQAKPGATTFEQLQELWGKPKETSATEQGKVCTYAIGPFPRVDATFHGDTLHSIVVHLRKAASDEQIEETLRLTDLEPVDVVGGDAKLLGRSYPERGITLSYRAAGEPSQVAHVMIEALSAEQFLLRAKNDPLHRWQQNLDDIEAALTLHPEDARAWWLKAEILSQQSEFRPAALAIEQALKLKPDLELYQLTAGRLIAKAGHYDDAIAATRAVADGAQSPPLLKARAALQMGDLLADSPQHDYVKALEYHQQAIAAALPLASGDSRPDVRRAAKRMLIEAHLAIAHDVARGAWKDKPQTVGQWLDRADALVDEVIANESADAWLAYDASCHRLAAYTWLDGEVDPTAAVETTRSLAGELTQQASDPTYRRDIQWRLGKALVDAVDVERSRSNVPQALEYGEQADKLLVKINDESWHADEIRFQLSRLYFLLGSLHSVQREDHAAAIEWFDKAVADISRPEPDVDLSRTALRGEWMVSMGISYWKQGDQRRGLRLTELGAGLIESAHREGATDEAKLIVPYSNLAFMHKESGDKDKAQEFANLASRIEDSAKR